MECKSCGAQIDDNISQCPYCNAAVSRPNVPAPPPSSPNYQSAPPAPTVPVSPPSKITAGICGIFLGALGIHKFVLGYKTEGIIMLCITVFTCGWGGILMGLIGLIEGIIYLTKNEQDFLNTYVIRQKKWF